MSIFSFHKVYTFIIHILEVLCLNLPDRKRHRSTRKTVQSVSVSIVSIVCVLPLQRPHAHTPPELSTGEEARHTGVQQEQEP